MAIKEIIGKSDTVLTQKRFEGEFSGLPLRDGRNRSRLGKCFSKMMSNPGKSIPDQCDSWAETKAFYRLLDHPDLSAEAVFKAHSENTLRRARESGKRIFLAIQDTSTLNFTTHSKLEGQGLISNHDKTTGLFVHSTMLMGADSGEIHGLLGSKIFARSAKKRSEGKAGARNREGIEEKESYRWLESFQMTVQAREDLSASSTGPEQIEVINVGDREADIYELLCLAQDHRARGAGVIVRSQHNREQAEEEGRIWESLAASEEQGRFNVKVPRKKGLKSREVTVAVRFQQMEIAVPGFKAKYHKCTQTVAVSLVEVRSVDSNEICWRLVTTLPVPDLEQARLIVGWYAKRWQIEVFHRVLKTGCRVERRQMRTMDRLLPVIALDMVIAVYLMGLLSIARSRPGSPASALLGAEELNALCRVVPKKRQCEGPLTVEQAVLEIARLGGFLARKNDGPPGAEVLWRGIQKLHTITHAWSIFSNE